VWWCDEERENGVVVLCVNHIKFEVFYNTSLLFILYIYILHSDNSFKRKKKSKN